MLHMKADQRVLGYLGRALSFELSAVQLYSTQSRLVDNWGLKEVAEKLSKEATEEMAHANRIISRMLALGVVPSASQLRPVRLGKNLLEILQYDYRFEHELIKLYEDATRHCTRVGDHDNRVFFEALLNEEKSHAAGLMKWLVELQQPEMQTLKR